MGLRTWGISVVTGVTLVGSPLGAQSTSRPDAAAQVHAGMAVLHRARTGDGRQFDRARDAFRRAHALDPEWAYPLLAIGWAEGGKGDWLAGEPLNLGTRVGHGAYRAALRALIEASEKEAGLTEAVVEMDRVATALRDTVADRRVLDAIRQAVARGNADAGTLLILGRRERSSGDIPRSVAALRQFLSTDHNPSLASLELARSLLTDGGPEGEELYFASARSTDSATVAELRSDLVPLADEEELARFDQARGSDRERFLRRFWEDRARRDLRSPGERIREHYRRLRYARQQFVLSNNRRYYGLRDLYRAPRTEILDDRGVVYVRHGEPGQRIRPQLFGLLPNESWLYRRPDGDLLLHFSAGGEGFEGGDLTDYRLVPSVSDLRGDRAPDDMVLASRFEISDLFEKMAAWGPLGAQRIMQDERDWVVSSTVVGTRQEGFELEFARPLEAVSDLVAIGRRDGKTLVQIVYALPEIEASVPVRVRVALFDSLGTVGAWLDSVAPSQSMDGETSGGRFEFPASPGTWSYRMALQVGEAGMVTPRIPLVVPAFHSGRLTISGVALGQESGNLAWAATASDTAQLHPDNSFPVDGELKLYYEVYGLKPQARYETSVNVLEKRRERAGRSRLRFNFEEEGQEEITRIIRSVRLAGLAPGEYWLEIMVKDDGGRQATVRKAFRIYSVTQ